MPCEWIDLECCDPAWWQVVVVGLLGACVGSFLNVVVYRLPRGLSVNKPPRSFCPTCGAAIPWYHNLPIISWLLLRGRSVCCKKPISIRYWLVELSSALLFSAIAWYFNYEQFAAILLICLWAAGLLAMLAMDWTEMVVHPKVACATSVFGLAAAVLAPQFPEVSAFTPWEGLLWSCVGITGGFVLFRVVALVGHLLFGRREFRLQTPEQWTLRQRGEDICLTIDGHEFLWSHVFSDAAGCLSLRQAKIDQIPGEVDTVSFSETSVRVCGTEHSLEQYESLSGTASAVLTKRAAMGSGDAWIAMSIGAFCGWQGVVFSLVIGSFIGLALALLLRIRRGQPMPFGPALILAAYVWLFVGPTALERYWELLGAM